MRIYLCILFTFLTLINISAQEVWMHPNKGQWDSRILYKVELDKGEMYLEKDGFAFLLFEQKEHSHNENHIHTESPKAQFIKKQFIGSSFNGKVKESNFSTFYRNYLLGNDSKNWHSNVYSASALKYDSFYPGIDLLYLGNDARLEYRFEVNPGADVSQIQFKIDGADAVFIDKKGQLHIKNRFGETIESAPIAWNENLNGSKQKVSIQFKLNDNIVSFELKEDYDESKKLIIDPYLVFSSFTGSTADNWGMTATPDSKGNLYAGGIIFGIGYPTTPGAFDITYSTGYENGFNIDVGISKFNTTGTNLIYSTYLGGSGNETTNSIVCSPNGELYILGVTSSNNFPMTPSAYDNSFNGGPTVTESNLPFSGSDIFVSKLNATGTGLLGSTYIGGSNTDGLNTTNLKYNYGDQFRGEIILDQNGNAYVSSTTQSANFPIVQGSQGSLNGSQDAIVFKMNPNLSTLIWSTYFGGSLNETGNALQLSTLGSVFVTGGTSSSNLPITVGNDLNFNGGLADGYLAKFDSSNGTLQAGTYMGMNEYDQSYLVQLDLDNNVYVFGQSNSPWAISPGKYGRPNSGQFIRKYSADLMNIEWTTMVGAGTGNVEISPTAFLVSDCYDIYLSGWGGQVNSQNSQATTSSSSGFQTTSGAFQTTTNGSNFYIAVLDKDATALKYATFMGGSSSSFNHVDGGTSRFDKSGRIYHAVCGACGGNPNGFSTTPGVYSPTNNSSNCNLAAFKFELSTIEAIVNEPKSIVCLPDPVIFDNNSSNGNEFLWHFGDGTSSNIVNPTHIYPGSGTYTVVLIVSDSNSCFSPDSLSFQVEIGDFQPGVVQPNTTICPGIPYQLEAYGGANYLWSPAAFLDDPSSPTPFAEIYQTTVFTVIISDSCGIDTVQLTLPVFNINTSISKDTSICIGNDVQLFSSGGDTYTWSPPTYLNNPNISNPISIPDSSIVYHLLIETLNGCQVEDSVKIDVYYSPPIPQLPEKVNVCKGYDVTINAGGAQNYYWSPNFQINTLSGPTVSVSPDTGMWYYCDFVNACGFIQDSVFVDVVYATINAYNDTIICPGQTATLEAIGGISYIWWPNNGSLNSIYGNKVYATPSIPTTYTVLGTDSNGCKDTADVRVDLFPQPFIQTSPDVYAITGDVIQLSATSTTTGVYVWSPAEGLSCVTCPSPITSPDSNMVYWVSYVDDNGCSASDKVSIFYDPIIYIPNTFTPDQDEFNSGFKAIMHNIQSFELNIFNRWGELIYSMNDFNDYWDGTYQGQICQDGTYVWKLRYVDLYDLEDQLTGHVNLLR